MSDEWTEWIGRYRCELELRSLASRTVAGRGWLLTQFCEWCEVLAVDGPQKLTLALVADYRRHRVERVNARGRRDGLRTVNLHLEAVRHFLGFLGRQGACAAALAGAVEFVKAQRRLPRNLLAHAEVVAILRSVPADTPIHVRDRAVLEVLYSSAIRRQEVIALAVEDLDLDAGLLTVRQGKGGKDRVVPVGRHAVDWVRRYLQAARPALMRRTDDHGRVFVTKRGQPLDGSAVREIVRRWSRAAGIGKPVTPHTLRRSCATEMIRAGANPAHVRDLLGHEDFTSLGAYVNLAAHDLKEAIAKYHPREVSADE